MSGTTGSTVTQQDTRIAPWAFIAAGAGTAAALFGAAIAVVTWIA
jgi:hypothetical protein